MLIVDEPNPREYELAVAMGDLLKGENVQDGIKAVEILAYAVIHEYEPSLRRVVLEIFLRNLRASVEQTIDQVAPQPD